MKRCFEANLAIFKTVNFAQPHRKFCRLLHVSLVLPGCACLMGNLDFKFPSLCLYPTPMNAGKSIKKLVEEFALAWSRKPALWRRRMGQKASILIWDQNPSLEAWLWRVRSLLLFMQVSVLWYFWRTVQVIQRGPFASETPKLGADKYGADS